MGSRRGFEELSRTSEMHKTGRDKTKVKGDRERRKNLFPKVERDDMADKDKLIKHKE